MEQDILQTQSATTPGRFFDQATAISALHNEIEVIAGKALPKVLEIGRRLTEVRAGLKHGEWLPWVTTNLPFSDRTARNYIKKYKQLSILKLESTSDLTAAYKLLAAPKRTAKSTPPKPEEPTPAVEVQVELVDVMFKCEECGHEVEESELEEQPLFECEDCGTKMVDERRCPDCDQPCRKVSDYACPSCNVGALIEPQAVDEPTSDSDTDWDSFNHIVDAIRQQIKELSQIKTGTQHAESRDEAISALVEELEALLR